MTVLDSKEEVGRLLSEESNMVKDFSASTSDGEDISSTAYARVQAQIGRPRPANQAGLFAAVLFLVLCVLLLIGISQGANLQELLEAAVILVLVNAIAAVVWLARAGRNPSP